jgi:hypothetical protein
VCVHLEVRVCTKQVRPQACKSETLAQSVCLCVFMWLCLLSAPVVIPWPVYGLAPYRNCGSVLHWIVSHAERCLWEGVLPSRGACRVSSMPRSHCTALSRTQNPGSAHSLGVQHTRKECGMQKGVWALSSMPSWQLLSFCELTWELLHAECICMQTVLCIQCCAFSAVHSVLSGRRAE